MLSASTGVTVGLDPARYGAHSLRIGGATAALAAGGTDDGAPGFRADYGPRFFVSYLRDPQGNKIALFSSNPKDPARDA